MDLFYPLIPKWVPLNFIWRHCDVIQRTRGNVDALKIYVEISNIRKKIVEAWDFRMTFGWICNEMTILI